MYSGRLARRPQARKKFATQRHNKTTQGDSMSRTAKRRSNRLRTQLSNQALEALCAMPVIVLLSLDPTLGAANPSMAETKKRGES